MKIQPSRLIGDNTPHLRKSGGKANLLGKTLYDTMLNYTILNYTMLNYTMLQEDGIENI